MSAEKSDEVTQSCFHQDSHDVHNCPPFCCCCCTKVCCHEQRHCSRACKRPNMNSEQLSFFCKSLHLASLFRMISWCFFLGNRSFKVNCLTDVDKHRPKSRRKMPSSKPALFGLVCLMTVLSATAASVKEGRPPSIVASDVTEVTAHVGQTLQLPCLVSGNPFPDTTWTKDGKTIERHWKRFKVSQSGLRIRNAEVSDSGTYYCQAVNGFGAKHVQVLLVVKDKRSDRRRGTVKPVFTEPVKMRKQTIEESYGHDVRLKCKAKGKPRPQIEWFKDGNLTTVGYNHNASKPQWTLILRNINSESSGRYMCRVRNIAGSIEYEYTLRVIGHPRERPVLLTPHPVNTTVKVGEKTSIQCRVRSQVRPTIKWIKRLNEKTAKSSIKRWPDTTPLKIDDLWYLILPEQETMELPDGSFLNKLVIDRAAAIDAGMYICFGANAMGYNFRYAYLTVTPNLKSNLPDKVLPRTGSDASWSLPLSIGIPSGVAVLLVCFVIMYCFCARDRLGPLVGVVRGGRSDDSRKRTEVVRFVDGGYQPPTSSADDDNDDTQSQAASELMTALPSDSGASDVDTSNICMYPFITATSSIATTSQPLLSIKTPFNTDVTVTSPIDPEHSLSGFSVGYIGAPPPPPPSQYSRSSSTDVTSSSRRHRHRRHSCSRGSRCHHHHHHAHRHGSAHRHHHRADVISQRPPPEYSEEPTC